MSPREQPVRDGEVDQKIDELFKRNYEDLLAAGGHALAESARRQALEEVKWYWKKLKAIAISVTETEVKLTLPGQRTPQGRPFVIEGIVDIVRDGDQVRMYDLKTHEAAEVRTNQDLYKNQLNVYAYIWRYLRGRSPDHAAVIATRLPKTLRAALRSGDSAEINEKMASWEPVVELSIDEESIDRTIEDFGRCVDAIEEDKFQPPSPDKLAQPIGIRQRRASLGVPHTSVKRGQAFAESTCGDCDARFSCESYRRYQQRQNRQSTRNRSPRTRDETTQTDIDEDVWIEDYLTEP